MAKVNVVLLSKKYKGDEQPIRISVSHESKRKYFSLNNSEMRTHKTKWDTDQGLIIGNRKNREHVDKLNTEILKQKQHILDIINDFEKQKIPWTLDMLVEARENKPKTSLFSEIANKFINSRDHITTRRGYVYINKSFINFCGIERYEKLVCSEINYKLVKEYFLYLTDRGTKTSTIKSYLKFLKTVLNLAIRNKVCSEATHPFKEREDREYFDLNKLQSTKVHRTLPTKYLKELLNHKGYTINDIQWQMYSFSQMYEIRIPFPNLALLKKDDIKTVLGVNGAQRQFKYFHKGHRCEYTVTLTPKMEKIIQNVEADYKLQGDYIFPIIKKEYANDDELKKELQIQTIRHRKCIERSKTKINPKLVFNNTESGDISEKRFYDLSEKRAVLLFSFSHYAQGMNLIDMAKLKHSHIQTALNDDGKLVKFVQYIRTKTGQEITFPITDQLQEIIDFFDDYKQTFNLVDGYILPIAHKNYSPIDQGIYVNVDSIRQSSNNYLKKIARDLGWPEAIQEVTLYWARHTYAQRCLMSGASKEFIQNALGHKELSMTENYLLGFSVFNKNDFNSNMFQGEKIAI